VAVGDGASAVAELAEVGDGTPGSGAPVWRVVAAAGLGEARLVRVNTTVGISSCPSTEGSPVPAASPAGVGVAVTAGADATGAADVGAVWVGGAD
jgi:hypothetical protein